MVRPMKLVYYMLKILWIYKMSLLRLMLLHRCMGHNRGWEEAASTFSGAHIELKTCNAALLEAAGKSWEEVSIFHIAMTPVDQWSYDTTILRVFTYYYDCILLQKVDFPATLTGPHKAAQGIAREM